MIPILGTIAFVLLVLLIARVKDRMETEKLIKKSKARAEARAQYIGLPVEDEGINYIHPVSHGIWTTDEVK